MALSTCKIPADPLLPPFPPQRAGGLQGCDASPSLPPCSFFLFSIHQNMTMPGKLSGKKCLLLMNKVVVFLPALTFPSRAGISPRGAVTRSGVQGGSWGCPGTPELFLGEWSGAAPKTSMWDLPSRPGNTTHGRGTAPGINGHPPGMDPWGRERKGVLHPFPDAGTYFCARPKPAAILGLGTSLPGVPSPREHPC